MINNFIYFLSKINFTFVKRLRKPKNKDFFNPIQLSNQSPFPLKNVTIHSLIPFSDLALEKFFHHWYLIFPITGNNILKIPMTEPTNNTSKRYITSIDLRLYSD